jgi:hypothetical protein
MHQNKYGHLMIKKSLLLIQEYLHYLLLSVHLILVKLLYRWKESQQMV